MGKLKLQMQTTLDGYVGGPNGEMDWMIHEWDDALNKHVGSLTDSVNTILLGRNLAEGFIPYWTGEYNSEKPAPGANVFVETPKVVFSRTLTESKWNNTRVENGDLAGAVKRLKEGDGDLIAYGGGTFVSELIRNNLIDEYHLFVNPTAISEGMTIFRQPGDKARLKLVSATPYECGIVALLYSPSE